MKNQKLQYNTALKNLKLPQYGRHIQKMIDECANLEAPEKRQKMAKSIVAIMANLHSDASGFYDLKTKLWNQLFIISDFKIRLKTPHKQPDIENLSIKPSPLFYPSRNQKYRYYGQHLIKLIKKIAAMEPQERKEEVIYNIANYMKKLYLSWNKNSVQDEMIIAHLQDISKGNLSWNLENKPLLAAGGSLLKNNHKKNSKNQSIQKK